MKNIRKLVKESLVYEVIDGMIDEDYPTNFNMETFKTLRSFNKRIQYCQANLRRISSGSSRIVYMIDNEKVLKLAKNKKGVAQNEVEIQFGSEVYLDDVVANVLDSDNENYLWVEMELATKLTQKKFNEITGFKWDDFYKVMSNHKNRQVHASKQTGNYPVDPKIDEAMWEDEFCYKMLQFMGDYDMPVGDLIRTSSYGIVKRDGQNDIVLIDFGFTNDVMTGYYS